MFFKYMWKAFLWAFFIFIASGMPGNEIKKVTFIKIPHQDKITHLVMYFLLSYLCIDGFKKQFRFHCLKEYSGWYAVFISVFYGILLEVFQLHFFSKRSYEFLDIIANTLGSIAGWKLMPFWRLISGKLNKEMKSK